jgi:aminopeptidase N
MKNLYSYWDSKKCFIISLLILFFSSSYAQIPESGQNVLKNIAGKELRTYKKMKSSEYTMTSIQEMFDVTYYSIEIKPDPGTQILTGTVEIVCDVLSTSLDSIELNFWDGMIITDIHLSDPPDTQLLYSHTNDILSIALDSTFFQGEQIALKVSYYGSPQNSGYETISFGTLNGRDLISTTDATGIMAWCPCKEIHSDKADSIDFKISVPSELIAASNGRLRNTTVNGDTTTYWWHVQYPISTNSISFAIYPYTVYYDDYLYNNNADTMKIHFYMVPEHVDPYYIFNSKIKDMITVFSGLFGEYPFVKEKYGMADILTQYRGIEGQTLSSLEYTTYKDWNDKDFYTEWIINHELAHQWWGASVMAYTWHHVWLLEGFATYASAFWYEHLEGAGAANDYMMNVILYRGPGTVYVEDPSNLDEVFDWDLSYCKAAWVLHMLRHTVTDTVFFEILKMYASSPLHQYGNATTEDFQAISEQVSGMNLQKFFQQWIYQEYYPFYEYNWTASPDSTGFRIDLTIDQVQQNRVNQNAPLFWMPIDVNVTTNEYDTVFVVWDSLSSQSFEFYLDSEPIVLKLDPYNWILKRAVEVPSGIARHTELIAKKFTLSQNYPNPFNPSTTIKFTLPKSEFVEIKVYNILGKEMATLVSNKLNSGNHTYTFDGKNLASGVYYYQIVAGDYREVKKMVLIR